MEALKPVVDRECAGFHIRCMITKHRMLMTIGYEGAEVTDFVASLRASAVTHLIDIRALAMSELGPENGTTGLIGRCAALSW